jgi:uncharacterized membrane protein
MSSFLELPLKARAAIIAAFAAAFPHVSNAEARSSFFDRLSILILSIQWTVFGSMHFSLRDETIRMLPDWIPYKPMVVTVTGMIEVATGILLLVSQTRRWAAFVSLSLLVLYIPAVYHILASDQALSGNAFFQTAFRVGIMPNNNGPTSTGTIMAKIDLRSSGRFAIFGRYE